MKNIESNSRYIIGGKTTFNTDALGFWNRYVFTKNSDDIVFLITHKYHHNPSLVAHAVYGDVRLFWFVLQYNNIIDVNKEFVTGVELRLPTPRRLQTSLLR